MTNCWWIHRRQSFDLQIFACTESADEDINMRGQTTWMISWELKASGVFNPFSEHHDSWTVQMSRALASSFRPFQLHSQTIVLCHLPIPWCLYKHLHNLLLNPFYFFPFCFVAVARPKILKRFISNCIHKQIAFAHKPWWIVSGSLNGGFFFSSHNIQSECIIHKGEAKPLMRATKKIWTWRWSIRLPPWKHKKLFDGNGNELKNR